MCIPTACREHGGLTRYLRQSRPALPAKLQGVWRLFDSEQRLDFVLHELPLDAALLGDSCDAGDERRLPLSPAALLAALGVDSEPCKVAKLTWTVLRRGDSACGLRVV